VITGVDAEHVPDGEAVVGPLDDPDLVPGPHVPLDDDAQVSPGPQGLGEPARERLVGHPNPEPPARDARLGHLQDCGPDPPPLADERIVDLNPFGREVLA
jgi:hypothetical protein